MENLKNPFTIISSIILTAIIVVIIALLHTPDSEEETPEELKSNLRAETSEKNSSRKPASVELIKADVAKAEIVRTVAKKENYQDGANAFEPTEEKRDGYSSGSLRIVESPNFTPNLITTQNNEHHDALHPKPELKKAKDMTSVYGPFYDIPVKKDRPVDTSPRLNSSEASSTFSAAPVPNNCSANISGGSFNHPIGVTLSCSTISTITYCLSKDTGSGCCDPRVSGTTYHAKINIGASDANYCLSFYGDSNTSGLSDLYQHNYIINSTLPDLQVGHQQIYYQTTQLSGKVFLSSLDFGKTGYGAGVINLKSHDPGIAGENLNCGEIVQNYSSLLPPAPLDVLSLLDVSLENPTNQLEIPLRLEHMDYGTNFITGYMLNDNHDLPVYSCSTSEIVLSDFEFFEQQLSFGDPGDNSTREFTGGLTSFGFFEPEATLYRVPAGISTEEQNGEKLQYGMFGIFF